jgi:hypothetical protein
MRSFILITAVAVIIGTAATTAARAGHEPLPAPSLVAMR